MMTPFEMPAYEDPPEEGTTVSAGAPLPEGSTYITKEEPVVEVLREIYDPEIPVNIYDLGLIYDVIIKDKGEVEVVMTLTAPACPVAGILPGQVAQKVSEVEGVGEARVMITWDPPWTPEAMSEYAQAALDMF